MQFPHPFESLYETIIYISKCFFDEVVCSLLQHLVCYLVRRLCYFYFYGRQKNSWQKYFRLSGSSSWIFFPENASDDVFDGLQFLIFGCFLSKSNLFVLLQSRLTSLAIILKSSIAIVNFFCGFVEI